MNQYDPGPRMKRKTKMDLVQELKQSNYYRDLFKEQRDYQAIKVEAYKAKFQLSVVVGCVCVVLGIVLGSYL